MAQSIELSDVGCAPDAQAERVNERLRDKKMRMELTDAAADYLAVRGFRTALCVCE